MAAQPATPIAYHNPPTGARSRAVGLPCPGAKHPEQYLSQEFEATRIFLLKPLRLRWAERARQADTIGRREYAAQRAASLGRRLQPRLAKCGHVVLSAVCGNGVVADFPRGCRLWWLCGKCRARRSHAMTRRITESLERAVAEGPARARLRLLTLTVRHSGNVDEDRRALARGWRAFYKSLHRWLGRHAYVGVWEVTPGRDALGHAHLHVAIVWPRFVAYGRVRRLWLRACPESRRINIQTAQKGAHGCAQYLAKYMSKGVDTAGFTDDLKARIVASFYNARLVLTSWRFWGPKTCDCCGMPWKLIEVPATIWLRARARDQSHGGADPPPDERRGGGDPPSLFGEERSAPGTGHGGMVCAGW